MNKYKAPSEQLVTIYGFNYNPIVVARGELIKMQGKIFPDWFMNEMMPVINFPIEVTPPSLYSHLTGQACVYLMKYLKNPAGLSEMPEDEQYYINRVLPYTIVCQFGVFACTEHSAATKIAAAVPGGMEQALEIMECAKADQILNKTISYIDVSEDYVTVFDIKHGDIHLLQGNDDPLMLMTHALSPRGIYAGMGCVIHIPNASSGMNNGRYYHRIVNPMELVRYVTMPCVLREVPRNKLYEDHFFCYDAVCDALQAIDFDKVFHATAK